MQDIKKKMYLVKREIWAKDIAEASTKKEGRIYEIQLAQQEFQEEEPLQVIGFKTK